MEIDAPSLGGKVLLVSNIKVIEDASSYTGSISGTIIVVDDEAETTITITASDIRLERDDVMPDDRMHYSLSHGTVHEVVTRIEFDPERTRTVAQSSQDAEIGALLEVFGPIRPQGPDFAGRFWLEALGFSNNITPYPLPHSNIPLSNYCPDRRAADGAGAFLSYGQDASVLEGSFSGNCIFAGVPYDIDMQWSLRAEDE
ncbi:MAG TPA: hypothetical protein PKA16_06170 [Ottowia sp.]|uniref:hypothetical protein n=1 Tax=Ottowia sp. TaxID=1898956 RepID=UPI002B75883A|nr:hypothetical protein [Ottowia sp.]HMN20962.1 hypothetical protein [Ottowia sp.]